MSKMSEEEYDEIYRRALAACRPKAKPIPPTPTQKAEKRFAASNQPTAAVYDTAARRNDAAIERLEETMEDRRRKQMAKEYAEHNAESPGWHSLVQWRLSVERAQERLRALDGEIPERGVYDPIRRFEGGANDRAKETKQT